MEKVKNASMKGHGLTNPEEPREEHGEAASK
jgi:hypothetical protein